VPLAYRPEEERSNLTIGTAHLLEYLKATEPKVDFRFCLGADAYHDLMAGKWIESERILQLVGGEQHLVIFQRAGHDDIHNTTRASSTISKQRYVQIPHLTNVSSSQVRACTDLETIQELVLPEVLAYILENKLYAIGRQQTANANES
jgi:nicotinic acid mononucleotide adenylyltransferase